MRAQHSPTLCAFIAAALLAQPVLAFQSPLSDQSLREEAYFAGQRHDGAFERLLESHSHHFAPPKTGPYISSVIFFTPFMMAAEQSSEQLGNYSAQQAAIDHRDAGAETVQVTVKIQLTDSYGQFISNGPASTRSGTSNPLRVTSGRNSRSKFSVASSLCIHRLFAETRIIAAAKMAGCFLTGATLQYEFPAEAFSDSAGVMVTPPEGDAVTAVFELSRLR